MNAHTASLLYQALDELMAELDARPLGQGQYRYPDTFGMILARDALGRAREDRSGVRPHDCTEYAVPCTTDGPLGHGWECGACGAFLQAG
jgi:hypothetical protein